MSPHHHIPLHPPIHSRPRRPLSASRRPLSASRRPHCRDVVARGTRTTRQLPNGTYTTANASVARNRHTDIPRTYKRVTAARHLHRLAVRASSVSSDTSSRTILFSCHSFFSFISLSLSLSLFQLLSHRSLGHTTTHSLLFARRSFRVLTLSHDIDCSHSLSHNPYILVLSCARRFASAYKI